MKGNTSTVTAAICMTMCDMLCGSWVANADGKTPTLYCTYLNPDNKDRTIIASGITSCRIVGREKLVLYQPCEDSEKKEYIKWSALKASEVDCKGIAVTLPPGSDWAKYITGTIVAVQQDGVTIAYEGIRGMETLAFKKNWLAGGKAQKNGKVIFYPYDFTDVGLSENLDANLAKFMNDSKKGLLSKPETLVGVIPR